MARTYQKINKEICNIPNLMDVKIDTTLPVSERIAKYVKKVRNPYLCRVDDVVVEIKFTNKAVPLQSRINNLVDSAMKNQ